MDAAPHGDWQEQGGQGAGGLREHGRGGTGGPGLRAWLLQGKRSEDAS